MLLDRADLSLLRGKRGEASTFFWRATEAAIKQAASDHMEPSESVAIPAAE